MSAFGANTIADAGSSSAITSRNGDVSSVSTSSVIKAPSHDAFGVDADQGLRPVDRFGATPYLDSTRPPRREDIIDHDSCTSGSRDVFELLGGSEIVPSYFDDLALAVNTPTNRCDMGLSIAAHGRDTRQSPLGCQISDLSVGEYAH